MSSTRAPDPGSTSEAPAIDRVLALVRGSSCTETAAQAQSRAEKIRDLQKEVAQAFGAARGWKLSVTSFSPAVLARRGVSGRPSGVDPALLDHACYYRTHDRRAVGIVAHLYDLDADAVRAWARSYGLRASFPPEPSWWYPGWKKLVLYEPCDSALRRRLDEIREGLRVDDCPVVALGHRGGVYYFLTSAGEIRQMKPRDMMRGRLLALFDGDLEWLVAHFGEIDRKGQKTGRFAVMAAACHLMRRCAAVGLVDPTNLVAALAGVSCGKL
jgi:hypothetical protein